MNVYYSLIYSNNGTNQTIVLPDAVVNTTLNHTHLLEGANWTYYL